MTTPEDDSPEANTPPPDDGPEETSPGDSMRATSEDKLDKTSPRGSGFPVKSVLVVVVIALGLFLLFYPGREATPPEPEPVTEAPTEPEPLPPAEDIPEPAPEPVAEAPDTEPAEPIEPAEPPLPAPEDSDPLLREQIEAVGAGGELAGFAEGENLVQRLVALVDGSSRGALLRKILPMEAPDEPFPVARTDGELFMDPAGYDRYDPYVDAVMSLDVAAMVDSFHRLRPLYEQVYGELGLEPDDLDNAVIRTLDRILDTPEIEGPIPLESKTVMYTYADPQLEALTPVQKQLLRTGPDNIRRIKERAAVLREALLTQ